MTTVTIIRNASDHTYKEFHCFGHARNHRFLLTRDTQDIVCASISVLVINTINSIEEFTDDPFTCDCRDGMIESWEFTNDLSAATELLMDSLMLGLANIVEAYGEEYLKVEMVEK